MKIIAGVDIGNSTTEVCIGALNEEGKLRFLSSASRMTTGTKGTVANVAGIQNALEDAMNSIHRQIREIELIRINEAAPVIGDTAMETISETIITESSMIGHNPATPAGAGQAVGYLLPIEKLDTGRSGVPYILTVSKDYTYDETAEKINRNC